MHTLYFAAMTFSAIHQYMYPQKDRKWHMKEYFYNSQLSAKGYNPYASIVCTDLNSMKSKQIITGICYTSAASMTNLVIGLLSSTGWSCLQVL